MASNYIVGTGGASIMYMRDLYADYVNNDLSPHQKIYYGKYERLLYLYAHPLDILISFHKRGYLLHMIAEINSRQKFEEIASRYYNVNDFKSAWGKMKLKTVIEIDENLYQFRRHYDFFMSLSAKVMAVKYEDIGDHNEEINEFLQTSGILVRRWKRKSNRMSLNEKSFSKLFRTYAKDIRFYESQPAVVYNFNQ